MSTSIRRAATVVTATGAALAVLTGTASAHFCYLKNPADASDAGRAASGQWMSFADAVRTYLPPASCGQGIAILATAAGVTPETLVFQASTLAQGTFNSPKGPGNPAVGYLEFEALEAAIPDAFAACAT